MPEPETQPDQGSQGDPQAGANSLGQSVGGAIGSAVGGAVGGAIGLAVGSAGQLGRLLGAAMRLPGIAKNHSQPKRTAPGARPGIEHMADADTPPASGDVRIQCIDWSPDRVETAAFDAVDEFLQAHARPDWATMRWINIDGLHPYVVKRLSGEYHLHTLAAEDVLHTPQRPRVEVFEDLEHVVIIARMLRLEHDQLVSEQISMFLIGQTVITFQELPGDVWQPIRERINTAGTRLRANRGPYLVYALLDAIVDHCYPILERYGDTLERMELQIVDHPTPQLLQQVHAVKRELSMLRRVMWPMREVITALRAEDTPGMSQIARTYLRDVYEHVIQIIDIIETFREMAGGLTDLHMSAVSNRMNEVMKVLTIIATLFIPITFLAGIYGMNFEYLPELSWRWAYPAFWVICTLIVAVLLTYFYRRGWLGRG